MNRIFKFVLPGALLLLVCLIACNKDNPASGLFSNGGATEGYTSSSELSIASAKNYFQSKKKESSSRDTTTSSSIVDIMQNLELEWNLADTILYQNITPVIVVPIKSVITPFHHSTMIFFLNKQNVIESRLFTVVTDSTYTPSANFSKNFNGFVAQINWSGDLVHSYRIDNGIITAPVSFQTDSRDLDSDRPCPPGEVLVVYMDGDIRIYGCVSLGGNDGGTWGGGLPYNHDPFGLGGDNGNVNNGNNGNNNNGGGGSGANGYLTNFFDPNDFEGLAKKSALLVNAFKSKYILYNSSQILLNQLIDECGLENNEEDLYGELLEILNGPPQPCVQTVINNDRILFFQQTYGLAVTLAQLQSINNAGLLVNSNTFINFFVSKNLNATQVTWLIQNIAFVISNNLNFIDANDISRLIQYPDLFAQFTNFLNNSPNATQEDKEVALRMVVEAPTNPIANLAARLNCFNTSGNLNMTHKITLHVDQPDANSNKSATSKELAGHTFLTLEQDQGGQNGTVRLSAGLYPANSATFCDQIDPGAFNNDEGHDFDVSVTWEISGYAFTQMVNDMKTHPFAPLYNLSSNNCTTWAVDKLEKAGIYVPRTNVVSLGGIPVIGECRIEGLTPGQLGQDLRNNYPLPSGAIKNSTGGYSPSSTCQ